MAIRVPTFFPERVNLRVPDMKYDGILGASPGQAAFIEFQDAGSPLPAISATNIISAVTMPADAAYFTAANFASAALPMAVPGRGRYGVCLQFVASGACTGVLEVKGRDYLGQRMTKRVTMNGNTPVTAAGGATLCAFYWIDSIQVISGTAAVTISVGTQNKYGLPYAARAIVASTIDGVTATAHTLVTRITTTASTSTADPRGLITFSSAADGSREFGASLLLDFDRLHGVAHNG